MRALHVHSGNLYGGVETILRTIARRQADVPTTRHSFALCFPGRCADELAAAGASVTQLGAARVRAPWTVLAARRRLTALLRAEQPDVIVTHAPWPHALFAPVARRCRVPIVSYLHTAAGGRHWLERWARRTPPDLVICVSHFVASTSHRLFPGVRAEVLYSPVEQPDGNSRTDKRSASLLPNAPTVMIQVSRMEAWKGHAVLIEALHALAGRGDWTCWIVGGAQRPEEAAYEQRLRARVDALGLAERVHFLGQRDDVPALLSRADICCQPNTGPEGLSITFVEAIARGLPVVTTDIGGGPEVVMPGCGMLVPPNDARALAEALGSLLDDPVRRAALGAAGPARAAELCDPARQLGRLGDLLHAVVQGEVPAPEDRPR